MAELTQELLAWQAGQGDIFALMRARLRAEPPLVHKWWEIVDADKDGRIVGVKVGARGQGRAAQRFGWQLWGRD